MSQASTAPSRRLPTGLIVTAALTRDAIDRGEAVLRYEREARAKPHGALPWIGVYRRDPMKRDPAGSLDCYR